MKIKNFTKRILCCAMLAASVITANAADRLLIVGEGVWGGWSIDNSIVMFNSDETPDVFKATVSLASGKSFKFLTTTEWGGLEYRAGENTVTLASGVAGELVSSETNSKDNPFNVAETANYDIVCDLAKGSILVTKAAYQAAPINHTALWIVGSATPGEWSIADGLIMNPTAENPLKFTATADLKEGELKFAVNKHTGYGQTFYVRDAADAGKVVFGGDDNKWNITEAGKYDITVDLSTMTVSIGKSVSSAINGIEAESAEASAEVFTLNGVKVGKTVSGGIYVKRQNGKSRTFIAR